LTEVKNVADMLEEVGIVLPDGIVVYYTIAHFPEEYEICKCMLLNHDELPDYETMEAKVLSEEISLSMKREEKGTEAFTVHRDRQRKFTQRYHALWQSLNDLQL
jgi:hypothetical protein